MDNRLCILLFAIAAFAAASCDVNKFENEVLLRTDFFSADSPGHVEKWVFISDQKGRLLDLVRPGEESGVIEFTGKADKVIMLTDLSVATFEIGSETRVQYHITTRMGIPAGSSYISVAEDHPRTSIPDPVGKASITLNNYRGSDDPWSSVGFSDGFDGFNNWLDYDTRTYDGSTFHADMNLREDPTDIFITSYADTEPVYSWVRGAGVGDSIVVDFDAFSKMNPVTINKPVHNAYIQGQTEPTMAGRGYFLSRSEYWRNSHYYQPDQVILLGYTDDFEYYDVFAESGPVLCCEPHERVRYHKVGTSVPQSIHLPDYNFVTGNRNLYRLDYSFDRQYSRKRLFFSKEEDNQSLRWIFTAPEELKIKAPAIPAEILAQYPFLDLDNLPLNTALFLEYLDGFSYQDYLRNSLENRNPNRPEFELVQYSFKL